MREISVQIGYRVSPPAEPQRYILIYVKQTDHTLINLPSLSHPTFVGKIPEFDVLRRRGRAALR